MSLASKANFGNYNPSTFGWGDPRPHLVPLVVNGVNFGQCAHDAHDLLVAFLTELEPLIDGGFHTASCWCWSTTDELPDGSHSFHWYGIAVDVNWNVNFMGDNIPEAHGKWAIPHTKASALARKFGIEYGGDWQGFQDRMHFEIAVSPTVARTVTSPTTTNTSPMEDTLSAAEVTQILTALDAMEKRIQEANKLNGDRTVLNGQRINLNGSRINLNGQRINALLSHLDAGDAAELARLDAAEKAILAEMKSLEAKPEAK